MQDQAEASIRDVLLQILDAVREATETLAEIRDAVIPTYGRGTVDITELAHQLTLALERDDITEAQRLATQQRTLIDSEYHARVTDSGKTH
jgi:hypothetical protein